MHDRGGDRMEDAQFLRELFEIVKQNKSDAYETVIREKASYPYLYHLSDIRQNLIDWLPITGKMRVLECNAECGALTGKLLAMAGEVVSVTEDETHAQIIRERYQDAGERLIVVSTHGEELSTGQENMGVSDLQDAKRFDAILIAGDTYRFRTRLMELGGLLRENGRLYVADANRLGLKYFAGCQEEYRGGYFTGIEGYDNEEPDLPECEGTKTPEGGRCYSRTEYTQMLKSAGFDKMTFYYPYPDHKFPAAIYSDAWLPHKGELAENRRNFDRDRVESFDEQKVYDSLLAEGLFGSFANSFLIEARK